MTANGWVDCGQLCYHVDGTLDHISAVRLLQAAKCKATWSLAWRRRTINLSSPWNGVCHRKAQHLQCPHPPVSCCVPASAQLPPPAIQFMVHRRHRLQTATEFDH